MFGTFVCTIKEFLSLKTRVTKEDYFANWKYKVEGLRFYLIKTSISTLTNGLILLPADLLGTQSRPSGHPRHVLVPITEFPEHGY